MRVSGWRRSATGGKASGAGGVGGGSRGGGVGGGERGGGDGEAGKCLAVACDRVQARFEREEATRTAAEAADRARRRQRPVDAMQADGNDMPGSETLGTGLMEDTVVGVASEVPIAEERRGEGAEETNKRRSVRHWQRPQTRYQAVDPRLAHCSFPSGGQILTPERALPVEIGA